MAATAQPLCQGLLLKIQGNEPEVIGERDAQPLQASALPLLSGGMVNLEDPDNRGQS
jgi:hypothetical protein